MNIVFWNIYGHEYKIQIIKDLVFSLNKLKSKPELFILKESRSETYSSQLKSFKAIF
jgi:hypothetical protein